MLNLASPQFLLLLPLPWIIMRWTQKTKNHLLSDGLRFPFYQWLSVRILQNKPSKPTLNWRYLGVVTVWCLLLIAASGPEWLGEKMFLPRSGRDIMLVLDISGSMKIPDMNWQGQAITRLDLVKKVAQQFIEHRRGDRLGLILFGTKAYLQTPLTFDRNTVGELLNDATVGLAGQATAIGDALGLAVKRFQQQTGKSRVVILLTDGGNNAGVVAPLVAAGLANAQHIKVYTIGLGADRLVVPGLFGSQVVNPSADLDEPTLQHIASQTNGLFFRAKNTKDLEQVYRDIENLEPVVRDSLSYRPKTPLYPWPLGGAFFISLYLYLSHMSFRFLLRTRYF